MNNVVNGRLTKGTWPLEDSAPIGSGIGIVDDAIRARTGRMVTIHMSLEDDQLGEQLVRCGCVAKSSGRGNHPNISITSLPGRDPQATTLVEHETLNGQQQAGTLCTMVECS